MYNLYEYILNSKVTTNKIKEQSKVDSKISIHRNSTIHFYFYFNSKLDQRKLFFSDSKNSLNFLHFKQFTFIQIQFLEEKKNWNFLLCVCYWNIIK